MKKIKVLSLFDGISIARQAIKNCGIKVENYYSSEIDKYAIQVSQKNWPDIIQLVDVKTIGQTGISGVSPKAIITGNGKIDLLIGGSPCQDLSIANKNRKGLDGSRSSLFYEYVKILNEVKPKFFILENVNSMPKEAKEIITKELFGIEPIMINASLVSAQNRKRLFWVGKLLGDIYKQVKIELPEDKGILLKDILESKVDEKYYLNESALKTLNRDSYGAKGSVANKDSKTKTLTASMGGGGGNGIYTSVRVGSLKSGSQGDRIYSDYGKSCNLSANSGGKGANTGLYLVSREKSHTIRTSGRSSGINDRHNFDTISIIQKKRGFNKGGAKALDGKTPTLSSSSWQENNKLLYNEIIRKLTPIECERLQSLPDNYTDGISNSQRYKALGNGFNCAVIEHIIKNLK